jgi:hypothetical protein
MSDGVDKAVMLLVAANFADQKDRIEDEPGRDGAKENDTQKNSDPLAPVEDDPATANRNRQPRQANSQGEEKINRLLAADDAHREIVKGEGEGVRWKVLGVRKAPKVLSEDLSSPISRDASRNDSTGAIGR